jgi:predicted nucleotidyltransferase
MRLPPLIAEKQAAIAALCRRSRARRLDLFGSGARPDFNAERSDLDFLVVFDELLPVESFDAYFTLKEGLEILFARQVDLVVERAIRNPYFKQRVQAERQPVYAA